jgi:unsaturated chondroitin disaccharide hydrolase
MNFKTIAIAAALGSSMTASRAGCQTPRTVVLRETTLQDVTGRIAARDSALTPAYRTLLAAADRALTMKPLSVMQKKMIPPSGNKHDYMSYAPYYWPDTTKPGGIPYIVRDGQMNPTSRVDHDGLRIQATTDAVQALALAHFFSGDSKYSKRAGELLRVFFLDSATRMNPNLQYAQAIPGITTGRGIGLVDTRILPQLVDAVSLLRGAPGWSEADNAAFTNWCREFLMWMRTSKNGNDERKANNNHGTWYDAQVVALALFTGDTTLARSVLLEDTERRIDEHFQPDGSQPRELARTRPLHYTLFNLDPYTQLAEMAPRVGVDLWRYQSPNGGSIRKGLEWVAPYADSAHKWSKPDIEPLTFDDFFTPLARGYDRLQARKLEEAIGSLPKSARDTSRTILLYPHALGVDDNLKFADESGTLMIPILSPNSEELLRAASRKLLAAATRLDPANGYPRSTAPDGSWIQRPPNEWTSGFFAGALWYMYELDHSPKWKSLAEKWTRGLEADKKITTTHDLGFLIFNSFGHGFLLTGDPHYKEIVLEASANLAKRYNPRVGMIKSWDTEKTGDARSSWKFPVIIDNLMNLDMLFWASSNGGPSRWGDIAHGHALKSADVHLRGDGSTAHVALFDPQTGKLIRTATWQGYSDSSAWARGQAWAMYGFTEAYGATGDPRLLDAARKAAEFFLEHRTTDDAPYWDFRDPAIPNAMHDASAAAIAASALFALARKVPEDLRYEAAAMWLLNALATNYLAPASSSEILMHAVGNKPQNAEVDVGLVYADYYYIEALLRERGLYLTQIKARRTP